MVKDDINFLLFLATLVDDTDGFRGVEIVPEAFEDELVPDAFDDELVREPDDLDVLDVLDVLDAKVDLVDGLDVLIVTLVGLHLDIVLFTNPIFFTFLS